MPTARDYLSTTYRGGSRTPRREGRARRPPPRVVRPCHARKDDSRPRHPQDSPHDERTHHVGAGFDTVGDERPGVTNKSAADFKGGEHGIDESSDERGPHYVMFSAHSIYRKSGPTITGCVAESVLKRKGAASNFPYAVDPNSPANLPHAALPASSVELSRNFQRLNIICSSLHTSNRNLKFKSQT